VFQSRAVFSVRCDRSGFVLDYVVVQVSIPCWVFCAPRPVVVEVAVLSSTCFNPVLGFLCAATPEPPRDAPRPRRVSIPYWVFCALRRPECAQGDRLPVAFQSRTGFSVRCDGIFSTDLSSADVKFQSRTGFSVRCDSLPIFEAGNLVGVSIPYWVFCALRLPAW